MDLNVDVQKNKNKKPIKFSYKKCFDNLKIITNKMFKHITKILKHLNT